MEIVARAAAIAVVGSILALLLRRYASEQALLLTLVTGLLIVWISASVTAEMLAALRRLTEKSSLGAFYTAPVLKCVGIGIITHLAAQICRDAQQGSLGAAVELCGTLCALYVSLPLIESLFVTVDKLL